MNTTYETRVLGFGKRASIEIPDKNLAELGANKRAPLKVTVNCYTYQSTATVMDGMCMVVFPTRDREASGAAAGDKIIVTLELDDGHRDVDVPEALAEALARHDLVENFHDSIYSRRKEFARQVNDAKTDETRDRRIQKVISDLKSSK